MTPKKKKILIIALAQSTHTHAWIDLISKEKFEVRLFGVKNTSPSIKISSFYYCLQENYPFINQKPSNNRLLKMLRKLLFVFDYFKGYRLEKKWLSRIIQNWQPDIIHTLGIDPAALHFMDVRSKFKLGPNYRWVVTIRGGSDIELERFSLTNKKIFKKIFQECDLVIADNKITYSYAFELGLNKNKKPSLEFIPGTGGMDIEKLSSLRKQKTSQSRIILWPKACEATYSRGLPVLVIKILLNGLILWTKKFVKIFKLIIEFLEQIY
ncbi:MAG: Glycosyl transferase group 1 [Berkelbacteria bacterium GW2011_GWA1_36_9]|uniref:Glycosyl transferase group 1 n=1 Tax=Berkelbacteria bacterium GW2011_GWA1_36_9 TaxID=1618331 RepID=A0A0G0FLU0_9BACT|nr:MAG: Glycosyl transferase group 1 [Berkelbacteria bacterium GW2011_GWA1_36_9]